MFREIRGVQQRSAAERKRWFQDALFDLFATQDLMGRVLWFQLCYRPDTPSERVLEWKRGRGLQHMAVRQARHAADRESGALMLDGALPHAAVISAFQRAAPGLPGALAGFVIEKIREHARPNRARRRKGAFTPAWIERLQTRRL